MQFNISGKLVEVNTNIMLGSEYIKSLVTDLQDNNIIVDIPDKYCDVISNYIDYANGSEKTITGMCYLKTCFELSTYVVDDMYFKYLLKQLFSNWKNMSSLVDNVNSQLEWEILLHCDYDKLPITHIRDIKFVKQWNNNKHKQDCGDYQDNKIHVDDNIIKGRQVVTIYHCIHGVKQQSEITYEIHYYNSGNTHHEGCIINDKRTGIWTMYYDTPDQIIMESGNLVSGVKDGLWKSWYNNTKHTLHSENEYSVGKQHGVSITWYDIHSTIGVDNAHNVDIVNCVSGKNIIEDIYNKDGECIGLLKQECYYMYGYECGMQRAWYDNSQHNLKSEGRMLDGRQHGNWKYWYDNLTHTLRKEGNYFYGKDGPWKYYDIDGNVINKKHYVYGVKQ